MKIKEIFDKWDETIIWSCLQEIMGEIYTNPPENDAALAILGDFAFYAGKPDEKLLRLKPKNCNQDFIIMVPQNEKWAELIEKCYGKTPGKLQDMQSKKRRIFLIKVNWNKRYCNYQRNMN